MSSDSIIDLTVFYCSMPFVMVYTLCQLVKSKSLTRVVHHCCRPSKVSQVLLTVTQYFFVHSAHTWSAQTLQSPEMTIFLHFTLCTFLKFLLGYKEQNCSIIRIGNFLNNVKTFPRISVPVCISTLASLLSHLVNTWAYLTF